MVIRELIGTGNEAALWGRKALGAASISWLFR